MVNSIYKQFYKQIVFMIYIMIEFTQNRESTKSLGKGHAYSVPPLAAFHQSLPCMMVMWSKALPLIASRLVPLSAVESHRGIGESCQSLGVRKSSPHSPISSTSYTWFVTSQ